MRMEVVTHDRMISLGIFAKDLFVNAVLTVDEDGRSFDVVQIVQKDTLDKIKNMKLEGGFTQRIKDGAIDAFSRMNVGDKFLCLNAWVTDYKGKEAKYYWHIQKLCNDGHSLQEAQVIGKEWLEKYEKIEE